MLTIENLSFSYKKRVVFDNISLTFAPGHIYGLLGENGVGKTTLLKLICGLQRPLHGECMMDGMPAHDRCPEMLQQIAFLPDDLHLPADTTPDGFITELGQFYPTFSHDYFLHLMEEMRLDAKQRFSTMSLGMQKKALLAAMLSLRTRYLLLDEPTNGLDIPSKGVFRQIMKEHGNTDTCIIISTHQVHDIEAITTHVTLLTDNAVLFDENVEPGTDLEALFNQVINQ